MKGAVEAADRMSEEAKLSSPYRIRPATPADLAFVRNCFVESLVMNTRRRLEREVRNLVRTGVVRVASDGQDDDSLLGFAIVDAANPALLHYAYVRKELRGEGIGRDLVRPDEVREHSFRTEEFERFQPSERGWTHSPRVIL